MSSSAESAREAVAAGVQGIIVSAHGGRQLDGLQAPVSQSDQCLVALELPPVVASPLPN